MAKRSQEIMEILEAFDLTRSYRSAAELAGWDPKTVAHHVERRDAGYDPYRQARRPRLSPKAWVGGTFDRSHAGSTVPPGHVLTPGSRGGIRSRLSSYCRFPPYSGCPRSRGALRTHVQSSWQLPST